MAGPQGEERCKTKIRGIAHGWPTGRREMQTPNQVFQRLLNKRTAFEYRQNAILRGEIPIDDSFDVALDELDRLAESTREHQKQDHSILLSGAGQTKDAERVGGHHRI
jgi:hypothetical protein